MGGPSSHFGRVGKLNVPFTFQPVKTLDHGMISPGSDRGRTIRNMLVTGVHRFRICNNAGFPLEGINWAIFSDMVDSASPGLVANCRRGSVHFIRSNYEGASGSLKVPGGLNGVPCLHHPFRTLIHSKVGSRPSGLPTSTAFVWRRR